MPSRTPIDPTVEQIALFIEAISRMTLNSQVQQRFAGTTSLVTPSELSALRALDRHARLTYGGLADRLNLNPTTVSRLAAHLLELGLVEREVDETDKRKSWLTITADGARILAEVESVYLQYYAVAIADWSPEDRSAARRVLAGLREGLVNLEFDDTGRAVGVTQPPTERSA